MPYGLATAGDVLTAANVNLLPRGQVAYAQVTANQGSIVGTEVDLTGLSVTFTATAGRRYRISGQVLVASTIANDTIWLSITDAANTRLQLSTFQIPSATSALSVPMASIVLTPSAGSVTYKLRIQRNGGSGTVTMNAAATYPAFIMVEDLGA